MTSHDFLGLFARPWLCCGLLMIGVAACGTSPTDGSNSAAGGSSDGGVLPASSGAASPVGSGGQGSVVASGGTPPAGSGSAGMSGGGGGVPLGTGGETAELDEFGYGVVGPDYYPPLQHRAVAVECDGGSDCRTDEDCGPDMACVCLGFASSCAPAECRTDSDCTDGRCLWSGALSGDCDCPDYERGFFCERSIEACVNESYCPGNGQACLYIPSSDAFECRILACSASSCP